MVDDELIRENRVTLQVVQALIGLITSHMKTISIDVTEDRVVLRYAMTERDEVDQDAIEDAIFELDALLGGHVLIETEVQVGIKHPDDAVPQGRRIYQAFD